MEETRKSSSYCNVEDKISRLPDNIIHHILSFIDTKHTVQTSVLSKRWIGIWKSIPYLNIHRNSFPLEHDQRFIYFVDMVFILRDDSDIQRFSLHWHNHEFDDILSKDVNRWIVHAVKRNVQEITLGISRDHPSAFEIPHQLLNCKSLIKLEMRVNNGGAGYVDVILPKSIDLPRLKVLWIEGLSISNVELSKRLFSSCPLLEVLNIFDCDIRNLTVNSLSLKKFWYIHIHEHIQSQNCPMANVIKLTAPNLKVLFCRSSVTQHYSLENCSLLSNVYFNMMLKQRGLDENAEAYRELPSEDKQKYAKRMMKFLRAANMVKELILSSGFLEVLSQALDISDCQPPRLFKLERLKLDMWFTRGCLHSIAYLISISPNIASISLESKEWNLAEVGDGWEAGLSFPGMLSHLEFVQIKGVEGCDNELKFLKFVLKNAMVLKIVVLYPRSTTVSPDRVREQFRDKLRALPRASSRIIMYWPATKSTHNI